MKNSCLIALCSALLAAFLLCGCGTGDGGGVITVIHSSDTHSCIEPNRARRAGLAGRDAFVCAVRDSVGEDSLLLLDCGDFSQGSLYYDIYKGAFEIDAMNLLRYDASAIGNHEFDFGLNNLASLLKRAAFPMLCANIDFTGTPCEGLVKPYVIVEKAGKKVGLFGLSPNLDGLVLKEHYEGVVCLSPIEAAQECVRKLRDEGCELVVCLSHLGFDIPGRCNDELLAAMTDGIDIILGGHSHDLFSEPQVRKNRLGKDVVINHTGKFGSSVGLLSVDFCNR